MPMKWIEPKKYLKKLELSEFPQPDVIALNYPVLMCHGYGGFSMLVTPVSASQFLHETESITVSMHLPQILFLMQPLKSGLNSGLKYQQSSIKKYMAMKK
jgi:hypothetical protein